MLGSELRAWRKSIGWTQAELMRELDVSSRQTMSNWENGGKLPRMVELAIIALDSVELSRKQGGFEPKITDESLAASRMQTFREARAEVRQSTSNAANDLSIPEQRRNSLPFSG